MARRALSRTGGNLFYPKHHALLRRYIVAAEPGIRVYGIWDQLFDAGRITALLNRHGFGVVEIYADVAGKRYADGSETLAVVARI